MQVGDLKGWFGLILALMHRAAGYQPQLHDMPAGNTNLVWHGGKLLALMDSAVPFLLNISGGRLHSMHSYTFNDSLHHEFSAHPKVDPKTGEMLSFGCKYALRSFQLKIPQEFSLSYIS